MSAGAGRGRRARLDRADGAAWTVKANPYGELFNSALPGSSPFFARSLVFEADFIGQLGNLDTPDINRFFYVNDDAHNWGESDAQGLLTQNYRIQTNLPGVPTLFINMLDAHAPPLDHDHFANRALTQSCGGCHEPSAYGIHATGSIADVSSPIAAPVSPFAPAGTTTRWPPSLGFTHTNESPVGVPPNDFYPLSQALTDVFLPARRANMAAFLAQDICPCTRRFVTVPRDHFERAHRAKRPTRRAMGRGGRVTASSTGTATRASAAGSTARRRG